MIMHLRFKNRPFVVNIFGPVMNEPAPYLHKGFAF